jgi:hypothetical protein
LVYEYVFEGIIMTATIPVRCFGIIAAILANHRFADQLAVSQEEF